MDGDRNLTHQSLQTFLQGLKLNKQESEFFTHLVYFTQAKTHEEKNKFYRHLLQSRKYSKLQPLASDQYDFYSNWYIA